MNDSRFIKPSEYLRFGMIAAETELDLLGFRFFFRDYKKYLSWKLRVANRKLTKKEFNLICDVLARERDYGKIKKEIDEKLEKTAKLYGSNGGGK